MSGPGSPVCRTSLRSLQWCASGADTGQVTPETAQLIRPADSLVPAFAGAWHATPNNVARSRRALLASLQDEELGEQTLDAIGAAVSEVTTNSVYHAYAGRRVGQFRIAATVEDDAIKVRVEDDGTGYDDEAGPPAGRGLPNVASLAARVETSTGRGSGTVTTMWFDRTH